MTTQSQNSLKLENISWLLISLNYEQLEYTENIILSKLPSKATSDDREKARENTIRLNRGLWLDETPFPRVRNSFRLSDWSK